MFDTLFDLDSFDKLPSEKISELDIHIGGMLSEFPEVLKQYNKEYLVYKVNKFIEKFVTENTPKKARPARKPKKEKVEVPEAPVNSEEEKQ